METHLSNLAQPVLLGGASQIGLGIIVILLSLFLLRQIRKNTWGFVLFWGIFLVSKGIIDLAIAETVGNAAWH